MVARVALLANPSADRGRAGTLVRPVLARLRAGGADVELLLADTAAASAALAAGAVADGVDVLVALGGDGLVSLAVQTVAGTGVPLGIVAAGTGNDAARTLAVPADPLAVPADPLAAADVVLAGRPRRVDLGQVGERHFLTVLSCGFDSCRLAAGAPPAARTRSGRRR